MFLSVLRLLPLYFPWLSPSFHLLSVATSVTTGIKLCEDYACYTLVAGMCYDSSWIPCVSATIINDNSHIDLVQLSEDDLYLYSIL